MKNGVKFILLAVPIFSIGVFNSYLDYKEPVEKSIDAWVYHIDWKSKNHEIPLILLKRDNNTEQKFHHTRIILTSDNLKVGDHLIKKSGSKTCTINDNSVVCLK